MKIAFDGQFFLKGNKTGIAWCAENVMLEIGKRQAVEKQVNFFDLGYGARQKAALQKFRDCGYEMGCCNWFHDVIYRRIWNAFPIHYGFFFRKKADVSVFFNFVVPPGVRGKSLAVVHDMAYVACPDTVRNKTRRFLEKSMEKSCKRADKIITISEFSKSEIVKYLEVPEEKIEVVPNGVDTERFRFDISEEAVEVAKEKYAIKGSYILYLGTIEPRKNVQKLIQAYALLKKEFPAAPQLILAGGRGWFSEGIYGQAEESGVKEYVRFLGYVADDDVPILLKGAEIFVFPSLYEGFGMPVLEAMACGTPVLTSNVASLPEVAGDAAVLVNPYDTKGIKQGMAELLQNSELRQQCREAGLARVQEYSWKKTADRYLEICEKAVQESI